MKLFAIGVGGSGVKCLEAVIHLHILGLFDREGSPPTELGVLFVEPDRQSALLQRVQRTLKCTQDLRKILEGQAKNFCRGEITDYGVWNPVESMADQGALTMDRLFAKQTLQRSEPVLGDLLNCLFTDDEQQQDLKEGFRGRPPIGSALMSAMDLKEDKTWGDFLEAVQRAARGGQDVRIHMFGSVFGGTGASGVPTVGRLLREWLRKEKLQTVALSASLLLPYFQFKDDGTDNTGLYAEASNFQLNTSAALQHLARNDNRDFDQAYVLGSDATVAYDFSIGGSSQANGAHIVELLAALGLLDSLDRDKGESAAAYTLSRDSQGKVDWDDLPASKFTQGVLTRGAMTAVAWRNNISLDLNDADGQPPQRFYVGAPWAQRFYDSSTGGAEARTLNSRKDKETRLAADRWAEALLIWLQQLCSSTGDSLEQKLLKPSDLERHDRALTRDVEDLKIALDNRRARGFNTQGAAGLLDTLWTLCRQQP